MLNQLPSGSQQPVLTVQIGQTIDAMYLGFDSDVLARNQITDYLIRVVQPKLQAVPGVQTAEILGRAEFCAARVARPARSLLPTASARPMFRRPWRRTTIFRGWAPPRVRWWRSI